MKNNRLNRRQIEVLLASARYEAENKFPPGTKQLAQALFVTDGTVSNAKRKLEAEGLIEKKTGEITSWGLEYLESLHRVVPISVPNIGTVYAGVKTSNKNYDARLEKIAKLSVSNTGTSIDDYYWIDLGNDKPNLMPKVDTDLPVFSMVVDGDSMVDEHIKEGDVVLIQPFQDGQSPRYGELIVSLYLAPKDEAESRGTLSQDGAIDSSVLSGPTLKFYYPKDDKGYFRLSMRQGFENNQYTIKTKYVLPVARVIGVYRSMEFQYSRGKLAGTTRKYQS